MCHGPRLSLIIDIDHWTVQSENQKTTNFDTDTETLKKLIDERTRHAMSMIEIGCSVFCIASTFLTEMSQYYWPFE